MTIPAGNNYCPTCHEPCHDHPSVCTVCGTTLVAPPPRPPPSSRRTTSAAATAAATSALFGRAPAARAATGVAAGGGSGGDSNADTNGAAVDPVAQDVTHVLLEQTRQANREMRTIIESIRDQITATGAIQRELMQDLRNTRAEWEAIPAGLLDPNNASHSRPTSKEALKAIPRLTLHSESSMLYQSVVTLVHKKSKDSGTASTSSCLEFQATLAEFTTGNLSLRDCQLVVAKQPRTGKGGVLDAETIQEIQKAAASSLPLPTSQPAKSEQAKNDNNNNDQQQQHQNPPRRPVILYMERGDGVTFVQKTALAAAAGAQAVIIGNHTSDPWPYFMKDSKNEAAKISKEVPLVPTVMLKLADAQKLVQQMTTTASATYYNNGDVGGDNNNVSCHLEITKAVQDCIVCTDALAESQTIVRLPACGHVFHETCALQWLTAHNTCPYCRRELPTDNEAYEQERRRRQQTQSASGGDGNGSNSSQYQDFYG